MVRVRASEHERVGVGGARLRTPGRRSGPRSRRRGVPERARRHSAHRPRRPRAPADHALRRPPRAHGRHRVDGEDPGLSPQAGPGAVRRARSAAERRAPERPPARGAGARRGGLARDRARDARAAAGPVAAIARRSATRRAQPLAAAADRPPLLLSRGVPASSRSKPRGSLGRWPAGVGRAPGAPAQVRADAGAKLGSDPLVSVACRRHPSSRGAPTTRACRDSRTARAGRCSRCRRRRPCSGT